MSKPIKEIPLELKIVSVIFLLLGLGSGVMSINNLIWHISTDGLYPNPMAYSPPLYFIILHPFGKIVLSGLLILIAYYMRKGEKIAIFASMFVAFLMIFSGFLFFLFQWVDWGEIKLFTLPILLVPLVFMLLLVFGYRKLRK